MALPFDFEQWREKGQALAGQAAEALRGRASGMSEQAVQSAVDHALGVLAIAVDRVKSKQPPPPTVSVGVGMSLGLVYLEMTVVVPEGGDPGELSGRLRRAAGDGVPSGEAVGGDLGGGGGRSDDVP